MSLLNQCISIKSQKHSNIKCTSKAVSEGFCSKHCKKRIVFVYSQKEQQSVIKIQKTWKKYLIHCFFVASNKFLRETMKRKKEEVETDLKTTLASCSPVNFISPA